MLTLLLLLLLSATSRVTTGSLARTGSPAADRLLGCRVADQQYRRFEVAVVV